MSFVTEVEKLEQYVAIRYVLKILGIVLVVLAFLVGWHQLHLVVKALLVCGILAFFVGLRFDKIYGK